MDDLAAFKINVNGKILDYRVPAKLDLKDVTRYFEKKYKIKKIWSGGRHVVGLLEKSGKDFFLKLSTTEGIAAVTKNEFEWNNVFNKQFPREESNFWVPQNYDSGYYRKSLFYFVTDKLNGELLHERPDSKTVSKTFFKNISGVIEFSELIQKMKTFSSEGYREKFIKKVTVWFKSIPPDIINIYQIEELLDIVKNGSVLLQMQTCHGDFTPWHTIAQKNGKLGLIDGEHYLPDGIENYDICYFIQRVFSVIKSPNLAQKIFNLLLDFGYGKNKLKVVLAARAIGGYLDESLTPTPNYVFSNKFKKWVLTV